MNSLTGRPLAPGEWHLEVDLSPYATYRFRAFCLNPRMQSPCFRIHVLHADDSSELQNAWSWLIRMLDARNRDLAEANWRDWRWASGGHVVELPRDPWLGLTLNLAQACVELGVAKSISEQEKSE